MIQLLKPSFLYSSSFLLLLFCSVSTALAGAYLDSAHGDISIGAGGVGVERSSTSALGYTKGNCAHCHEQHASIEGTEPSPAAPADDPAPNPNTYAVFYDNFIDQTDGFCLKCHIAPGSQQTGGSINNYDYSTTFGGQAVASTVSIYDAFNPTAGSAHDLVDILTELTNPPLSVAIDNPCGACHNPHLAQKNNSTGVAYNPTFYTNSAISLPSDRSNLWGDAAAERMLAYTTGLGGTAAYRAPFFGGANPGQPSTAHEPDGQSGLITSPNVQGANTPDYTTFCLDCHSRQVQGTNPVRIIPVIPWAAGEQHSQHGPAIADGAANAGNRIAPYTVDGTDGTITGPANGVEDLGTNFVLSCLDCHEPHGANQVNGEYLLRTTVNSTNIDVSAGGTGLTGPGQWYWFCISCHTMTTGGGSPHGIGIGPGSNCSGGNCHDHSGVNTNF